MVSRRLARKTSICDNRRSADACLVDAENAFARKYQLAGPDRNSLSEFVVTFGDHNFSSIQQTIHPTMSIFLFA